VPLVLLGLVVAWRAHRLLAVAVAALVLSALAIDVSVPDIATPAETSRSLQQAVRRFQDRLGTVAAGAGLRRVLVTSGGEAQPELPFDALAGVAEELPAADALILVDERGAPIAWTGTDARLPLHLRPLGQRAVAAESGFDKVRLWWREPIYEAGRPRGAVLAAVTVPQTGARQVLAVGAGRAAVMVPLLRGGVPVTAPDGSPLFSIELHPSTTVPWSTGGEAAVLVGLLLLVSGRLALPLAALACVPAGLLAGSWLGHAWWLVAGLVILAWAAALVPARLLPRLGTALVAGSIAVVLPAAATRMDVALIPSHLLTPGLSTLALLWALVFVLRGSSRAATARTWPLAAAGWLSLGLGLWWAAPVVAGVGVAFVVLWGLPRRWVVLPPLVAAAMLIAGHDALTRSRLVADTNATLDRIERIDGPARTLVASLPAAGLADLVQLSPREQLVALGRLASGADFTERLPGCSLVVLDAQGLPTATWGEVPPPHERPRELAGRSLPGGGRIVVISPPSPHNILAALSTSPSPGPVAIFNRSGGPLSRSGTFRPLSSMRVGRALAEGRSWSTVVVGERRLSAYLRASGEVVIAVPWLRLRPQETLLLLTALALWGSLPLALWASRNAWRRWWTERTSLTGRLLVLSVAITALPLVLLGNLLPQQWTRHRERARLELARAVSEPLSQPEWSRDLTWLVRDLGGVFSVYEGGELTVCTHPDLAVRGIVPWMAPRSSYVRAVRGWLEPIAEGREETRIFAPVSGGEAPTVIAVTGLRLAIADAGFSPREWFVVTGVVGLLLALAAAEWLGRRLTRPLHQLVGAAQMLEQGRTVEVIDAPGDAETDVLARAFNTMARAVRDREEDLRRERDLLEEVLGTLSAAVSVASREEGRVELANPAARALLGANETLEGFRARFGRGFDTLLARAGSGTRVSETLHPTDGRDAVWRVSLVPLPGWGERLLLVMEDLSEVARAERLASLAELARIVAHEVKNPLTPIRLWAEEMQAALDRDPDDLVAVVKVAAEQILERVRHLREVAQGFSNLVAIERWQTERVDLAVLARTVVAEYGVVGQRGVRIETVAAGETSVDADALWLRRALRHLLENSVRAVSEHGGHIVVAVRGDAGQVELTVSDTGGGVAEEHLGRLFEPHFSTTSEGTGLGLAVVRRVATRAGGAVSASNTAEGLEVRLVFPTATGQQAPPASEGSLDHL
jgi:signal transduction histidine kinase